MTPRLARARAPRGHRSVPACRDLASMATHTQCFALTLLRAPLNWWCTSRRMQDAALDTGSFGCEKLARLSLAVRPMRTAANGGRAVRQCRPRGLCGGLFRHRRSRRRRVSRSSLPAASARDFGLSHHARRQRAESKVAGDAAHRGHEERQFKKVDAGVPCDTHVLRPPRVRALGRLHRGSVRGGHIPREQCVVGACRGVSYAEGEQGHAWQGVGADTPTCPSTHAAF